MNRRIRLLVFNLTMDLDHPIWGATTAWVRALAERVDFIHVITMSAGRIEVQENVRVYSVGKERGYSESRRAIEFYRHLFHILKEDRIDACFSHMIPIFSVLAGPVLKFKSIPLMTWYAHPSLPPVLRLAHWFSDRMVTALTTSYPYRHNKLVVLGQGIDPTIFQNQDSVPADPPIILCAGRLSPSKDHGTLIEATRLLCQRYDRPFRTVVVGGPADARDESYVQSLHKRIDDLGLKGKVSIEPPVAMRDLPSWFGRCTLHVNLTRTGFGDKVACEAMACSRPCLVANEGYKPTLGEYAHRLWFRYGDPEDLADKLKTLLEMPATELTRIGSYLCQQVLEMHNLERLADRLIELAHNCRQSAP